MADQPQGEQHISGERARGGQIILRTRARRIVFIAGLAGFVLLSIIGLAAA